MANGRALVLYGRGGSLGNFKFFADDLLVTELASYDSTDVLIKNVERRDDFFAALDSHPGELKELHLFSHSIGGGLFLGYGDPVLAHARSMLADTARGGRAFYESVLNAERGTLFADDLVRSPYAGYAARMRSRFLPGGTIKIWGCNSGISGWRYSDEDAAGNPVYDLDAPALYYYWRALNERYMPKPSIAQAFADYFRLSTFGATSGSSIQIRQQGTWNNVPLDGKVTVSGKRRFVGERDVLRLAPDVGNYREYKP